MSGFTIPGLGFAKPNETLPPPPPDAVAAATSSEGTGAAPDSAAKGLEQEPNPQDGEKSAAADPRGAVAPAASSTAAHEPMNIDREPSPPSLTSALEAALGAPEPMNTTEDGQAQNGEEATTGAQHNGAQAADGTLERPEQGGQDEHPEWEIDSSPYESSSSDSSSDSSDDEEEKEGEGYELMGVDETARMLMELESDDDGEGGKSGGGSGQVRTKNEQPFEAVPKPDVTITPDMKIEELGAIDQVVDNFVVVRAFTPGEYQVLDTGSVLCSADRTVLGAIYETIGKVLQPMYTVMFSSPEEVAQMGLEVGTKVYYPAQHAKFVFTQPLRNVKGSDASNIHDEEIAEDEMEFSDDEKEAEHKRQAKQKRKDKQASRGGVGGGAGGRGGKDPHPLRNEVRPDAAGTGAGASGSGGLNYDDDDDGPYKPLQRPASFVQGPPIQQGLIEEPEPGQRFGAYRGGRGDHRGRGRGRGDRGRGRGGRGRGRGGGGGGGYHPYGDSRDGYSMPAGGQRAHSQQQQHQPQQQSPPAPASSAHATNPAPSSTSPFNFPQPGNMSAPPQQPGQNSFSNVPPPPPGWPGATGQNGQAAPQGGQGQNVPHFNPAFFAAILSQMQRRQQAQQPGQQPPQPPPQ